MIGAIDEAGTLTLSGTVTQADRSSGAPGARSEVRVTARTDGAGATLNGDLVQVTGPPPCMVTMTSSLAAARRFP